MASEEYKRLQEALRKAPTPEARREAAERFRQYERAKRRKGSKPTIVSMGFKKTYPHAVPLDKIPDEIERDPEFFELMGRIVKAE